MLLFFKNYLLEFSFTQLVTDSLAVLTSLIDFIKNNALLIMLVGIPIVMGLVFSLINYFRSR